MQKILSKINDPTLQKVELSGNQIDTQSAVNIAEILKVNTFTKSQFRRESNRL